MNRHQAHPRDSWLGNKVCALVVSAFVLATTAACSIGNNAPTAAVGDKCLVGLWTELHEENVSAYQVNGEPVSVAGLQGARLTIESNGTETLVFDSSQPLVGTTRSGAQLAIRISGTATFHIHGDGKHYVETGSRVDLPTTATLNGVAISYSSFEAPGEGTYTCSASSLVTVNGPKVQTDTWSR